LKQKEVLDRETGMFFLCEDNSNTRQMTTNSRNYEYVGCFNDARFDRILEHKMTDEENATPDVRRELSQS